MKRNSFAPIIAWCCYWGSLKIGTKHELRSKNIYFTIQAMVIVNWNADDLQKRYSKKKREGSPLCHSRHPLSKIKSHSLHGQR